MKGKRWFGKIIVYYLLALIIIRVALGPFSWWFPRSDFFAEVTRSALFELANTARAERLLPPLQMNAQLNLAAYHKAQDMLEKQYFAHHSPEGKDPWHWFEKAGYHYRYAGENLAIHFLDSARVHQAWMESEAHRKNIMHENYQEMGMAVVRGEFEGRSTTIVVQLFGTPLLVEAGRPLDGGPALPTGEILPETAPEAIVEAEDPGDPRPAQDELDRIVAPDVQAQPLILPAESDWRLVSATSVTTEALAEDGWFRFLKFLSRSYENMAQQMIFYGIILVALYFVVSLLRRPGEDLPRLCGKTAVWVLILFALSLLSKDTVLNWISYQINIG